MLDPLPQPIPDYLATSPAVHWWDEPMPIRPENGSVAHQSPPDFTWPNIATKYKFRLTYPDSHNVTSYTTNNWFNWGKYLPPGPYSWQVWTSSKGWSAKRHFNIALKASPFVVPSSAAILCHILMTHHPRGFPQGPEREAWLAAITKLREKGWKELLVRVDNGVNGPMLAQPSAFGNPVVGQRQDDGLFSQTDLRQQTNNELDYIRSVLLAAIISQKTTYISEAKRRLFNLATWNPNGPTGYAFNDQTSRDIAWLLALGYDWLYSHFTQTEHEHLLQAILERTRPMISDVLGKNHRVESHPFDSHRWQTYGYCTAIASLIAGDSTEANNWAQQLIPSYITLLSVWGGEDGGYANGTSYAEWDNYANTWLWQVLKFATGVDVFQKPWVKGFGNFITYFLPPQTPLGLFGDGADQDRSKPSDQFGAEWPRYALIFARQLDTPLTRWAAHAWGQEADEGDPYALFAPPPASTSTQYPSGQPNSAVFPSIGWVAIHSNLADPDRTSIYFKSSPYGSFNHSHADQNSFAIYSGRQPLAINSGYYDQYNSPHWSQWTKRTMAQNAVTFDGGQGQGYDTKRASGKLTFFSTQNDFDAATGDATNAYEGQLSKAIRTIVYIRPNTIFIYDSLASAADRTWEWNLHAKNKMKFESPYNIQLTSGDRSLCVDMLESPPGAFNQADQFTVPPSRMPNQWHARFASQERSKTARFLAVLRIGCEKTSIAVRPGPGNDYLMAINGQTIRIGEAGAWQQ